jgi:AcrR family transcriptional regulator
MRAEILAAARLLMRAEGAGALSWNEIARRVGLKPPSLYVYFDDKMALYDALFRLGWERYGEVMDEAMAAAPTGWVGVEQVAEVHFRFCVENPELFQLMFQRPIPGFEPSPESLALSFGILAEGRLHFWEMLAAARVEPPMAAEAAFDLFIAALYGVTAQHLANEPELSLGEGRFGSLVPRVVDLFREAWGRGVNGE